MRLDDPQAAGHLIAHVAEQVAFDDCGAFYGEAGKGFLLRAKGHPVIPVRATRGFWCNPDRGLCEFYLRIDPEWFVEMVPGVTYTLEAPATRRPRRFSVADGVQVELPKNGK